MYITWAPDGNTIAVGNKEDLVTFIDARMYKIRAEQQFAFEVNEISWNNDSNLFFLTNGQGCIHILRYNNFLHYIKSKTFSMNFFFIFFFRTKLPHIDMNLIWREQFTWKEKIFQGNANSKKFSYYKISIALIDHWIS